MTFIMGVLKNSGTNAHDTQHILCMFAVEDLVAVLTEFPTQR